jgi:hypothetical protein
LGSATVAGFPSPSSAGDFLPSGSCIFKNLIADLGVKAGLALDPEFTLRRFRAGPASDNPTFLAQHERLHEYMRKAGVPEE